MCDIIKFREILTEIGFHCHIDYRPYRAKYRFTYKSWVFEITDWSIDYKNKKNGKNFHFLITNKEEMTKMYYSLILQFSKELRKFKIKKLLNNG